MARKSRRTEADDAPPPRGDVVEGAPHPAETPALFGQGAAEAAFEAARAGGRLPHGWLLAGPRGVGKATLAYRIARAVIGGTPLAAPPGDDAVAARIRAGSEPRVKALRRGPNEKTGKLRAEILVDDVRAVKRFLEMRMPDGGWRVVIVDAADELTNSAANAMLKFLEEPPPEVLILMLAHAPGRLLPTIRSRLRRLDLAPLGAEDLAAALAGAGIALPEGRAAALAALSGGAPGRAVPLVAGEGLALYARLVAASSPGGVDRAALVALAEQAAGQGGAERARLVIELWTLLLARLARAAAGVPLGAEAAEGEAALAARLADRPGAAPLLAETVMQAGEGARAGLAVNLDPGQVILDMGLDIDAALARAI